MLSQQHEKRAWLRLHLTIEGDPDSDCGETTGCLKALHHCQQQQKDREQMLHQFSRQPCTLPLLRTSGL